MKFVMIDGEPWRVLADVCDVIGHSNPSIGGAHARKR
jgi:prophage antirepressor-like protein